LFGLIMTEASRLSASWLESSWPAAARADPEPWLRLLAQQAHHSLPLARQLAILEALGSSGHPLTSEQLAGQVTGRLGPCLGEDPGQTLRLDLRALRRAGARIRYSRGVMPGYQLEGLPGRLSPEALNRRLGPVDWAQMEALGRVAPGRRVRTMLEAGRLIRSQVRARLRRQWPQLSPSQQALQLIQELSPDV
jgi:predicted DNA-binding transcriptional regulator YafY